jgi:DNA-binding NarL/FixJ family response regulator
MEMTQRLRIAIVDDHPLFRAGVVRVLSDRPELEIVGEAGTAEDAVELVRREAPAILLLDLGIPGGGLNAARTLTSSHPGTRIVILTSSADPENVDAALQAGAQGYVLKGVGGRELSRIIALVMAGRVFVSPPLAEGLGVIPDA